MKILIILLTLNLPAFCPVAGTLVIFEAPVIEPYEAIWNAVCKVESNYNPFAIGDKHLSEWSYGIAQIRRVRLDDYYKRTGIRYYESDMFDPDKSKEVFIFYACEHNPWETEQISRKWNGGDKGMKKQSTREYYKLINKHLN